MKYSKADLIAVASKYKTRTEFAKGNRREYISAVKRGLLNEVCQHMPNRNHWTLEEAKKIASKYEYVHDFYINDTNAYRAVIRNHWSRIILDKMKRRYPGDQKKLNNKMTKQHLLDIIYYQQNALSKSYQTDVPKDMVMRYLTEMAGLVANLED